MIDPQRHGFWLLAFLDQELLVLLLISFCLSLLSELIAIKHPVQFSAEEKAKLTSMTHVICELQMSPTWLP